MILFIIVIDYCLPRNFFSRLKMRDSWREINFGFRAQVEATDNDEGENAEITYSIYHVSNNGLQKFKIDPKTGVIESVRKLNAGEQYSITVQATDKGGKYSQTIVEVNVIPGPNTRSPVFQQPVYEVQVSEGASINSTVATITVSILDTTSVGVLF